jgi:hypothetical protein
MPAPLPIRADRTPAELRRPTPRERDGRVSARLLALANVLDGLPRESEAQHRLDRASSRMPSRCRPAATVLRKWCSRHDASASPRASATAASAAG